MKTRKKKTIQQKGIQRCFLGFHATVLREVPSYGTYFCSYEYLCRKFEANDDPKKLLFAKEI